MQNIKLIAVDIGGTLIDDNNQIPLKNIETFTILKDMGVEVALVTARMYSSTKYISNVIGAKYGIYGNGSNIINLSDNSILYSENLDSDTVKKLIVFGKKERLYIHLNECFEETSDQKKYFALKHYLLNKNYPQNLKSNIKIVDDLLDYASKIDDCVKVVYVSEFNLNKTLEKINVLFPNTYITEYNTDLYESAINKTINYIELGKRNITKAEGLDILINKLGLSKSEVLVIGDGNNDIEMFDNYFYSGCLKNGSSLAKKHAKYISKYTNNEGGVSDIIVHFVKGLKEKNENSD